VSHPRIVAGHIALLALSGRSMNLPLVLYIPLRILAVAVILGIVVVGILWLAVSSLCRAVLA
jgi:hypothetical protein